MESMAACQAADVVVVFESVDTDSASVARCPQAFRREGSIDVLVIIVVFV
jgi:hypothetical protein